MMPANKKTPTLGERDLEPLKEPISFMVDPDLYSGPGPLNVQITADGIEVTFIGASEVEWKGSWIDLCDVIEVCAKREWLDEERRAIEEEEQSRLDWRKRKDEAQIRAKMLAHVGGRGAHLVRIRPAARGEE